MEGMEETLICLNCGHEEVDHMFYREGCILAECDCGSFQ